MFEPQSDMNSDEESLFAKTTQISVDCGKDKFIGSSLVLIAGIPTEPVCFLKGINVLDGTFYPHPVM